MNVLKISLNEIIRNFRYFLLINRLDDPLSLSWINIEKNKGASQSASIIDGTFIKSHDR